MSRKEFLKFKAAAEKIERECNTPEKAGQFLIKIGYLNLSRMRSQNRPGTSGRFAVSAQQKRL